jgi:phytol kinase
MAKMADVCSQILLSVLAVAYAIIIVFATKKTFKMMKKRGVEDAAAVYYNRKIVKTAAGGIIAILIPYLFDSWIYPLGICITLAFFTAVPHATGKRMHYMQTEENWNDTKFNLMCGASIAVLWELTNSPLIAIIPALFMAFGDSVTGFVRNALYKKRTKSPVGNIFMLMVCIPIGYYFASVALVPIPLWGVLAAIVASLVEHFEFGAIDDNILITASVTPILVAGICVG